MLVTGKRILTRGKGVTCRVRVRRTTDVAGPHHPCLPGEAASGSHCPGLGLADPPSRMFPMSWHPLCSHSHTSLWHGAHPATGWVCLVSVPPGLCVPAGQIEYLLCARQGASRVWRRWSLAGASCPGMHWVLTQAREVGEHAAAPLSVALSLWARSTGQMGEGVRQGWPGQGMARRRSGLRGA